MNQFIVFGVSTGIGFALVKELLKQKKNVVGIGRRNSIDHPNYRFIQLDLNNPKAVEEFVLPKLHEPFVLIYNAGVLGEVTPFVKQAQNNAQNVFQVNYLSLVSVTHKALQNIEHCQQIIYISSGAANRAIPSWSQYCASKAAVNMFAETLQLELESQGNNCLIRSVAPGVVDTPMQDQIRSTSENDFSQVDHFKALKEKGELSSPEDVAKKLLYIVENSSKFTEVCLSLRNIN